MFSGAAKRIKLQFILFLELYYKNTDSTQVR